MMGHKHLELASTLLVRTIVAEQAVAGLMALGTNVRFFEKIVGVNRFGAYVLLFALYLTELATVVALCVPALKDRSFVIAAIYFALACALSMECALATAAGDNSTRTTAILLALGSLKHAVSAACSRRLRISTGSMGEDSFTDTISSVLRERSSRYKLAPTACIVIGIVVVYTVFSFESPLAAAPLSRMLGRSQYARSAALVALLAAVGSEDRSHPRYGHKKRF